MLDRLQGQSGWDVDIHVDGTSGALLAPFCAPDIKFDFRVPRAKSISTFSSLAGKPGKSRTGKKKQPMVEA